jgi:hypothetical protein
VAIALLIALLAGAAVLGGSKRRPIIAGRVAIAVKRPDCWPTAKRRLPIVGYRTVPIPTVLRSGGRAVQVTTSREVVEKNPSILLWTPCDKARLPKDASHLADRYSLGVFERMTLSGGIRVDEWDRPYGGKSTKGLFDNAFWDVLASAAYFIPGFGPAVSAGLTTLVSMARGETAAEALALAGCAALSPAASIACRAAIGAASSGMSDDELREAGGKVVTELGGEQSSWDAGIAAYGKVTT